MAVVMISLNEGHNMEEVVENLSGWAQEVFLVDSYSKDDTVDIALRHGVHVVQRAFRGYGDQWNFALKHLPIAAPWTMKLDPDERLSHELKTSILNLVRGGEYDGISVTRRLWFMGKSLPITQKLVRLWRTGSCTFSDVLVNEHPLVSGRIQHAKGYMEHHDSPDLEHWLEKQNRYTTAEAIIAHKNLALAETPRLLGSPLQRRMWLKRNFYKLPGRYQILFLYYWLIKGTFQAGWVGYAWAHLRAEVMRFIEFKKREMELQGGLPSRRSFGPGKPDPRVSQFE